MRETAKTTQFGRWRGRRWGGAAVVRHPTCPNDAGIIGNLSGFGEAGEAPVRKVG